MIEDETSHDRLVDNIQAYLGGWEEMIAELLTPERLAAAREADDLLQQALERRSAAVRAMWNSGQAAIDAGELTEREVLSVYAAQYHFAGDLLRAQVEESLRELRERWESS